MHRFFLPPDDWTSGALILRGPEAHHCCEVLRLAPGGKVAVFDGRGREVSARIEQINRREAVLVPEYEKTTSAREARITLAQAIPKGKNMDLVIQKATELGAAGIVPLITERTVVRVDSGEAADKQEKWQRVAIEACKQCGQNHVPVVRQPVLLPRFLADPFQEQLLLIAAIDSSARKLKDILTDWRVRNPGRANPAGAVVLIGPEGDFTGQELELAKLAGFLPMTLGPIILRTETAAICSLSMLAYELF